MRKKRILRIEETIDKIYHYEGKTRYLVRLHKSKRDDPDDETVFLNCWVNENTDVQSSEIKEKDYCFLEGDLEMKRSKGRWFCNMTVYAIKVLKTKEEMTEMYREVQDRKMRDVKEEQVSQDCLTPSGDDEIPF